MFWILRLYPRSWRDRYGEELLAVLEQHEITMVTMMDLLLGALDANMRGKHVMRGDFMRRVIQSVTAVWAACAAVVMFYGTRYRWFHHRQYVEGHTPHVGFFPYGIDEFSKAIHSLHHMQYWLVWFTAASVGLVGTVIVMKLQRKPKAS